MPTPTNRTPVRVARGTYSNLNSSVSDIQEGEIVYATDQDKLYVKEGSSLVDASTTDISAKADLAGPTFTGVPAAPTATSGTNTTQIATTAFVTAAVPDVSGKANTSDIGTTIQAYDADTAKTDTAQTFTAAQRGTITTLTPGTTVTPDLAVSNNFTLTPAQNTTIANPTNITAGQSGSIFIVQDGTGSRTAAWGSYWDFAAGTAPTLTTTAAGVDRVDYIVRSATSIHAVFTGNYS
tara:strand:- start:44 stop:754 length:711 start_codon:yes stop_codon:yes gene_type:complete